MTKPLVAPEWATSGSADVVEPALGAKQLGYSPGDRPPAGWLNWFMNNVYEHIDYLRDLPVRNWVSRPLDGGFTGLLYGATYGSADNLFVIVGSVGEIETSTDGISWTQRANASAYTDIFLTATNGGGTFVIAGENGEIESSTTGVSGWVQRTPAGSFSGDFHASGFGNSLFVIAGTSGEIQTSPGGGTWTARTADGAYGNIFKGVAYGNSTYVLVGQGGEIQSSPDGTTWTTRTPDASFTDEFFAITYGNGLFVAVGETGEIQTSPDGITWTQQTEDPLMGTNNFNGIAHDDVLGFIAVGQANVIQNSINGTTWTHMIGGGTGPTFQNTAYGNGVYVVLKTSNADSILYHSLRI